MSITTSSSVEPLPMPSRAKIAVSVAGFCSMLNLYAPQAILPTLAKQFAVAPSSAALVITATTLAVALFGPFSGIASDRFGAKRVIVAALLCISVPTIASGLSTSLEMLVVTRFLQGMFMPAVFTATLGYIAAEWRRENVGSVTAIYIAANVSGGFAGRFFGGLAADLGDWHWTFFLLALINLTGAVLVWRLLPQARSARSTASYWQMLKAMPKLLSMPALLAVFAVGFNVLFGLVTIFTYINFYLAQAPYNLSPAQLGLVFCVYLIGVAVTPRAGRWIDRFGQRRMLLCATATSLVGGALTLLAPLPVIFVGLALFCTGVFISQAAATSQVGIVSGSQRSVAAGLYLSFYYLGGGLGAVVPGYFWNAGGWAACVSIALVVQLLAAAIAILLWRPAR